MIRRDLRKRVDTQKVTFNNFSKGMEFDNFAKDPSNPRVQYIKNLELNNGKLELRKPALPFIGDNGEYNMVLLKDTDVVQQVFFFPSLNNQARFIWLVKDYIDKDKDKYKFLWVIKVGQHAVSYADYDIDLYGEPKGYMESAYMQHLDTLYVKTPNNVLAINIDTGGAIRTEPVKDYVPNGWELTDAGINLYSKDPFEIKNVVSHGTGVVIDSILWYKEEAGKGLVPAIAPKYSDKLSLKARLSVSDLLIEKELDNIAELLKPTIADPALYMPKFTWYSKAPGAATYTRIDTKDYYMPLLATDLAIDKETLPATYYAKYEQNIAAIKAMWGSKRYDIQSITRGTAENTEYKLVIEYDGSKYDVNWTYKTLEAIGGVEVSIAQQPSWVGYKGAITNSAELVSVLSNDAHDLHLSNFNMQQLEDDKDPRKLDAEHLTIKFTTTKPEIKGIAMTRKYQPSTGNTEWGFISRRTTRHASDLSAERFIPGDELREYIPKPLYESATDNSFVTRTNSSWHVGTGELSYIQSRLPDSVWSKTEPTIEATVTVGGVNDVKYRPIIGYWFDGTTKLNDAANNFYEPRPGKGWFSGVTDPEKRRTFGIPSKPGNLDSELKDNGVVRTVPQDYTVAYNTYPTKHGHENPLPDALADNDPNVIIQYRISKSSNYTFDLKNDVELRTEGLLPVKQYLSLGGVSYSGAETDKSVKFDQLDIWIGNDYRVGNIGFALDHQFIAPAPSSVAVLFSTQVINKIELLVKEDTKVEPAEFAGAVVKYSALKNPTSEYKWDLVNSKYLFQYWEKLGLYGFDKEAGINKPYNYIMLSEPDNLSYFPNTRILDVYSQDNHLITKVLPWKNNLLGFTEASTTMFVGPDGERKETISTTTGLSEKNRNTAQVVSNSVVIKNGSAVIAFVPAAGTDNAASLNLRDISRQISDRIKQLDNENPISLFSTVYKHEYWLAYRFSGRTVILKYSWDNFAWTEVEYANEYVELFQYDANTIVAVDTLGHLYNLTSLKVKEDAEFIIAHAYYNGDSGFETGSIADLPGTYMDVKLLGHQYKREGYITQADITNPAKWDTKRMKYVYDGDTLTDMDDVHYRVLGVNTPEIKGAKGNQKIYAELAKQFVKDRVLGVDCKILLTGAKTYNRAVAKVTYGTSNEDLALELVKAGLARVDYITNNASDKYYYPHEKYILDLAQAQQDAIAAKVGMWSLLNKAGYTVDSITKEVFGFPARFSDSLIGAEWTPVFEPITYEFLLGNRKTSVENNMMTEEVTAVVGNEGNKSAMNQSYIGVYADNLHMKDFYFDNSHGAPTPHHVTPITDIFNNWMIGVSTHERPTVQGHTFKIRRSATTLNVKIAGTVAQKIYLDSVQFKFRETNRRAR